MAETEGVQIKITGDGSQAMREFGRIKAAMEQLRVRPIKLDWDIQHPNVDFSKLQLPANFGQSFTNELNNGINQVAASLTGIGTQLSTTFGSILSQIKYGILSVIGTTGLLTNEFRKSLAIGGGFEATMTSVSVVSSATADEMSQLTAKAREMGATLPITAQQAGQAMLIMAQRGTKFADILTTVEDVANLSIFQGTDMHTAASLLGSTMSQFSLDTAEASRIVDVFNNACNQSPLNMQHLVDAMQYVGPVAGGMGIKLEEVVAGLEALHKSGLVGSMAGTGLRMVYQKLAAKAQIAGVETKKLDGTSRSLAEIFGELQQKGYSVAQATKDFGARGANAAISLMKASGQLKNYEQGLAQVGTTSSGVQEKMKSWPNVWNTFRSASEELHIEIFDQIKEQAKDAVGGIANLTRAFSEWIGKSELAKKSLDAFLKGLGFEVPSVDKFKRMLENLNVDEFVDTVRRFGTSLRGIADSVVSFFNSVKTPLLFLIEHLGQLMTLSFWGWVIGNGMRVAGGLTFIAGGFFELAKALSTLEGAVAVLGSITSFLTGTAIIGGGAVLAHQISSIYDQLVHGDEKLAEFEEKLHKKFPPVDEINSKLVFKVTTDFKTGFEELPDEFIYASLNVQEAVKNRMEKMKENFTGLFLDVYNSLNADLGKPIKEISDKLAQTLTEALHGNEDAYKSLQPEMQSVIRLLKETGTNVDRTSQSFKDSLVSFKNIEYLKNLKFENTEIPLTKMQALYQSISDTINTVIDEMPDKVSEINSILGGNKLDLAVELQLEDAKKSLEAFIKATSKETGFSKEIISAQVFDRLNQLGSKGNEVAQSLSNMWKDSGKGFDNFLQKAQDYVTYMNEAPENFTPTLEKMAKGLQKIDPLTGKVTEQFKKAYNALKQWSSVTFDRVAKKIQNLRKAVEGGFIDKKALENEFRDTSEKLKLQIVTEYAPTKGQYQNQEAYRSVLASEYMSRLQDLGGETFVEMAKKEFSNSFAKTGSAIGEMIERTAKRSTLNAQIVRINGVEQAQNSQGFNMQSFTQALNPVVSGIQQLATQKQQAAPFVDYSSYIASIITELKNTNVSVQNVKVAVDNMNSNFATLGETMKKSGGGNTYNVEVKLENVNVNNKADAVMTGNTVASAVRQGLGNGGI